MKPVTPHCFRFVVTLAAMLATLHAGERALIDLTRSPHAIMYMPDLADVRWTGGLLGERFDVARDTMVPHLGRLMSDPKTSPAWRNYRIAAGLEAARFSGPPFNDGDYLKWLEALVQVYAITRDPKLDAQMDDRDERLAARPLIHWIGVGRTCTS